MNINLLPSQEKKLLRRRYFARVVLVASILLAGITLLSAMVLVVAATHLAYEVIDPARATTQLTETGTATFATSTLKGITEEITEVNKKIAIVAGISPEEIRTKQSEIIMRLTNALNRARRAASARATYSGFHLIEVIGDERIKASPSYNISLSGVADNRETLLALTKELRNTAGIRSVDNPISNYVPGRNLAFTITLMTD